jgi:putative addiction module component (TIGR02574 family)
MVDSFLEQAIVLSVGEKLQPIEALWESMSQNPENIPVSEWQLEELVRRIESQRIKPQQGQTWDEVKQEIRRGEV